MRIVLNLLSNAMKFTTTGGTVRLSLFLSSSSAELAPMASDEAPSPQPLDCITISVADSGPGVPARMREGHVVVGRARSTAVHLEGRLRLRELLRKKYRYGQSFGAYIARHPDLASRQLRLIRPAFVRAAPTLARHPLLAAGMLVMKALELAAGALGLATTRIRRFRREGVVDGSA